MLSRMFKLNLVGTDVHLIQDGDIFQYIFSSEFSFMLIQI